MATPITPQAVTKQKRDAAAAEYESATKGLKFSKDFHSNLEAIMGDPLATWSERLIAWLKRYSWGEYSLFALRTDGEPRTLGDAAKELCRGKDKLSSVRARLCSTAKYLESRNYLRMDEKKLYPVIAPQLPSPAKKLHTSATFSQFLEQYKISHSDEYSELEVARSRIKAIRKHLLSEYKKFQKSVQGASNNLYRESVTECTGSVQLSGDATLLPKILRKKEEKRGRAGGSVAVVTEAPTSDPRPETARPPASLPSPNENTEIAGSKSCTHPQLLAETTNESKQVNTLPGGEPPPAWHRNLESWLNEHGRIGIAVDAPMLAKIASTLGNPALLEQFQTEAAKVEQPRKYAVYVAVARQVAQRGHVVQDGKVLTKSEQRVKRLTEARDARIAWANAILADETASHGRKEMAKDFLDPKRRFK